MELRSFEGKYERVKMLGEGAFGTAYLVKDRASKSARGALHVAKEVRIAHLTEKQREGALAESKVLKMMKHTNIVGYIDSFFEGTKMYIIMEYADGGDLAMKIKSRKEEGKPFVEREVMFHFIQISLALDHIHSRKVLHRDLKPLNVFLTGEGIVKLGDFGIARVMESSTAGAQTTIGTPFYLSPEVCNSEPYGVKSDLWSLGIVTYELAALRVPFHAPSLPAVALKIMGADPDPLPPGFSSDLVWIVSVLLEKEPVKRPRLDKLVRLPYVQSYIQALLSQKTAEGGPRACSSGGKQLDGWLPPEVATAAPPQQCGGPPAEAEVAPGGSLHGREVRGAREEERRDRGGRDEVRGAREEERRDRGGREEARGGRLEERRENPLPRDARGGAREEERRDIFNPREARGGSREEERRHFPSSTVRDDRWRERRDEFVRQSYSKTKDEFYRNQQAAAEVKRRVEQQTHGADAAGAVRKKNMREESNNFPPAAAAGVRPPGLPEASSRVRRVVLVEEDELSVGERRKAEVRQRAQEERERQDALRRQQLEEARQEAERDRRRIRERQQAEAQASAKEEGTEGSPPPPAQAQAQGRMDATTLAGLADEVGSTTTTVEDIPTDCEVEAGARQVVREATEVLPDDRAGTAPPQTSTEEEGQEGDGLKMEFSFVETVRAKPMLSSETRPRRRPPAPCASSRPDGCSMDGSHTNSAPNITSRTNSRSRVGSGGKQQPTGVGRLNSSSNGSQVATPSHLSAGPARSARRAQGGAAARDEAIQDAENSLPPASVAQFRDNLAGKLCPIEGHTESLTAAGGSQEGGPRFESLNQSTLKLPPCAGGRLG